MSESTLEKDDSPETGKKEVTVGATGQELREHREALGADLGDVSDMLCIRRDFLEALEAGRYEALPGEAYAIGFVRSYAKYLGLDSDAMARQFKVELTGERPTARLDFLTPAAESRVPTAAIVFVAVLLMIAIYGLWYFFNARNVSVSDMVPEIPARLAGTAAPTTPPPAANAGAAPTATPAPAAAAPAKAAAAAVKAPPAITAKAPAVQTPAAGAASETPGPTGGETRAQPDTQGQAPSAKPAVQVEVKPAAPESPVLSVGGPAPEPAAAAPQEGAAGEAQSAPATSMPLSAPRPPTRRPAQRAPVSDQGADRGQNGQQDQRLASAAPPQAAAALADPAEKLTLSRIVLRAKDNSWVEVRTASGDLVISRVLAQGETYSVPPRPGLTLTTGNAGGLKVIVDGQALPSLGGTGKVRRDIALDPERLKSRLAGRSR
jgi:cytoskeleton protein RodZ